MTSKIEYPVGIQTFSEIIKNGYIYVDKTDLVYRMAHDRKFMFLSRPRRFGKSLLTSTLEAYFKGRRELFEGLAISRLEREWTEYPVFRFDLSAEAYTETDRLRKIINRTLNYIGKEYGLDVKDETLAGRFEGMVRQAYDKFGTQVVILIDEYDKPLLDTMYKDILLEDLKTELRGFYSVLKKCDDLIHFCLLTGVTKFGQVSVFSGINNLKDITMSPEYNAVCGISESEFHRDFGPSIKAFAEAKGLTEEESWKRFKDQYDGYHFAGEGEFIYNPFSVIRAFDENKLKNFWYMSGTPSFMVDILKRTPVLLSALEGEQRTELQLSDIMNTDDIIPFLYQAGYLTVKDYDEPRDLYTLGFPNKEVYESFWSVLAWHMFRGYGGRSSFDNRKFVADVVEGRPERFMERLQALFADTESSTETRKEIHFQNMMATACKMMGLDVRTEVRSSIGRCDVQIHTPRYVYIIEIKVDKPASEALEQIREKRYAAPFALDHRTVYLIGATFSLATRTIDGWLIEEA